MGAPWPFTDDSARNHAALKELAGKLRADSDKIVAIVPAHSGIGNFSALNRYAP